MDQLVRNSLTRTCIQGSFKMNHNPIMNLMFRSFGRRGIKYPKGSFGKENSLGFNSGFPKHKELFTEGYYTGEPKAEDLDK